MNKFKIGDLVCIVAIPLEQSTYLHSKQTIIDIIYYESSNEYYYILSDSFLHKNRIHFSKEQINLVSTSEQLAVEKFKEEFKSKLLLAINENNRRTGYSDLVDQDVKTKNGLLKEIIRVLESEEK